MIAHLPIESIRIRDLPVNGEGIVCICVKDETVRRRYGFRVAQGSRGEDELRVAPTFRAGVESGAEVISIELDEKLAAFIVTD